VLTVLVNRDSISTKITSLINAQYTDIIRTVGLIMLNPFSGSEIATEIQSEFARVDFNYEDKLYLTGAFLY
jgi:hypothetical protein